MSSTAFMVLKCGRKSLVDAEDLALLEGHKWYAQWRYRDGAKDYITSVRSVIGGKQVPLHRLVLKAPDTSLVDHINGDVLDNRKANLRLCTQTQNMWNRRMSRSNKCGLKGVYRCNGSRLNPWRAEIRKNGKKIHLGSFATPEDAHDAYVKASIALHGEFGCIA